LAEKLSRKELKEPDAFMKAGSVARSWFQANVRVVSIGLGLALLVVGIVLAADYLKDRAEARAAQELGSRLKVMERPVSETATTTGEDAPFKSARERDEAVVSSMAELRAAHGGTRAARSAALVSGNARLRLKQYDEAQKDFADFLQGTPPEEPLRATALEGAGYAHEAKGELDQALAAFDRLERENRTELLAGMGLYHRGRILALQDKKVDAARAFTDVASAHPETEAARLATLRLAELKAQGVTLPEPVAQGSDAGVSDGG